MRVLRTALKPVGDHGERRYFDAKRLAKLAIQLKRDGYTQRPLTPWLGPHPQCHPAGAESVPVNPARIAKQLPHTRPGGVGVGACALA